MLLHIISKSPLKHSALADALPFISKNDNVIFIDDGVYVTTATTNLIKELSEKKCMITALEYDLKTRGIDSYNTLATPIDMAEFVKLAFDSSKSVSWY